MSEEARRTLRYVEPLSEARTPLADFFSILLDKNAWLIRERGISFEQIIVLIESGSLVQVLEHHDRERYPNQLLYEVDVDGYIYVVPVVREHQTLFLKTVYPSRKATRNRAKGSTP